MLTSKLQRWENYFENLVSLFIIIIKIQAGFRFRVINSDMLKKVLKKNDD